MIVLWVALVKSYLNIVDMKLHETQNIFGRGTLNMRIKHLASRWKTR